MTKSKNTFTIIIIKIIYAIYLLICAFSKNYVKPFLWNVVIPFVKDTLMPAAKDIIQKNISQKPDLKKTSHVKHDVKKTPTVEIIENPSKPETIASPIKPETIEKAIVLSTKHDIKEIDFSVNPNPNKFIRCAHNKNCNKAFHETINAYSRAINNMSKISSAIVIGTTPITIEIPMVYHLLDPFCSKNNNNYWSTFITKNVIPVLNTDFNRSFSSYESEYIKNINALFSKADPSKKDYYIALKNALPKNTNITWKFYLKSVIIKSVTKLSIDADDLDPVFKATALDDPDSTLNIIIVPGKQLLGISVFPFMDRDPNDETKINPASKYKNAIIINTDMLLGKLYPYNKYRTFTHEIGHWCGLLHPFDNDTCKTSDITTLKLNQDGGQNGTGDMIADTSIQFNPTFGTVKDVIKTTKKNGVLTVVHTSPYAAIFQKNLQTPNFLNFMDYTDDEQMCMFTQLQMLKMGNMMARFRPNFVKTSI